MSLELTIGGDVQGAVVALKTMKDQLKALKDQLDKTTDPAEANRLTQAIVNQKNQIQQAVAASNGFANSTFGVSRAARAAHNDLDQAVRSIQTLGRGGEGAAEGLSGLVFTFERLKGITGSTKGAIAALGEAFLGPAGIVLAVGSALPLLENFVSGMFKTSEASKEAAEASKKFKDEIDGIFSGTAKEAAEVSTLVAVLKSETETRERKLAAIQELNKIAPETFNNLKLEGNAVQNLDQDYQNYLANLRTVIAVKIQQAQLEQKIEQLLKLQGATAVGVDKQLQDATKSLQDSFVKLAQGPSVLSDKIKDTRQKSKKEEDQIQSDIKELIDNITKLSKGVKVEPLKPDVSKVKKTVEDTLKPVEFTIPVIPKIESLINGKFTFQDFVKDLNKDVSGGERGIEIPIIPQIQTRIEGLEAGKKALQSYMDSLNKIVSDSVANIAGTFAEGIGQALGGGDISTAFQSAFKAIAGAFEALGKAMIAHAIAIIAFKKAFTNPIAELAAGAGLIIAGAALSTALGKTQKFAKGGIVTGPTLGLVGEAGPEVIMPLDKLKGMLGGLVTQPSQERLVAEVSGNSLQLVLNRTAAKNNRGV